MARTSLQPPPFLAYDTWSLVFDTSQDIPAGLLVVIFPEETIPSWSRGGAPSPRLPVRRDFLVPARSAIARVRVPGQAPLPLRPLEGLQVFDDVLHLLAR